MKWIFRLPIILMLTAALAMPFFMEEKDGQPVFETPSLDSVSNFSPADLFSSDPENLEAHSGSTHVYKWQDAAGQWHYGDRPPEDARSDSLQTVELDPNTNVIQSVKLPDETSLQEAGNRKAKSLVEGMTPTDEDLLSLERLQNVMKDAHLAADAMESRNDVLKQITGEK